MNLSVPDRLRMAVLGWQSECALRARPDLANAFAVVAASSLPDTAETCIELGRSMLRDRILAEVGPIIGTTVMATGGYAPTVGYHAPNDPTVASGEITTPESKPDHVHTFDPDRTDENCKGCVALVAKWRDDQVAKERARRDRWAEKLAAKARHLQDINTRSGVTDGQVRMTADLDLLAAFLIADTLETGGERVVAALESIESRLDKLEDRLIEIAGACYGEDRDGR